jgi:hypothetical protein
MAAVTHPVSVPAQADMDDLVDMLFDTTQQQLASMQEDQRAAASKRIDDIAAKVHEHA